MNEWVSVYLIYSKEDQKNLSCYMRPERVMVCEIPYGSQPMKNTTTKIDGQNGKFD